MVDLVSVGLMELLFYAIAGFSVGGSIWIINKVEKKFSKVTTE